MGTMADLGGGEDQVDGRKGSTKSKEDCSLVVSVFKGENFVVKQGLGFKCKLVAKVCKEVLETGAVALTPGNPKPNFNAQLAWTFNRKELQRSDGGSLRMECFLVNDEEVGEPIGYIVIAIKDAFLMNNLHEVDPNTAKSYMLLGTRDPWDKYHPKIRLHFHIEGPTANASPAPTPKQFQTKGKPTAATVHFDDKSGLSQYQRYGRIIEKHRPSVGAIHSLADPTKLASRSASAPKLPPTITRDERTSAVDTGTQILPQEKAEFVFSVNDQGYFELGEMSPTDDLYIVNVSIMHSKCLHLLELMPTETKDYKWTIEYKSFGFQICSDPFELDETNLKRGFIGDKATARIRANGATFFDYLSKTTLEFFVFRTKPVSQEAEEMGRGYLGLSDLTKPKIEDMKYDVEIVSSSPYAVSANFLDQKPELRVVFTLNSFPGFFSNEWNITNAPFNTPQKNAIIKQKELEDQQSNRPSEREIREPDKQQAKTVRGEVVDSAEPTELLFMNKEWQDTKSESATCVQKDEEVNGKLIKRDGRRRHRSRRGVHTIERIEQPQGTETGDSAIMEPGIYRIAINFEQLWIKCRTPILDDFVLSYRHSPMGLTDEVECIATPIATTPGPDPSLRCGSIEDGLWNMTISLKKLSNNLLYKPLYVKVSSTEQSEDGNTVRTPLATARIPFGEVFFQQEQDGKREIKKRASVVHKIRHVKIGYLTYSVQVEMMEPLEEFESPQLISGNEGTRVVQRQLGDHTEPVTGKGLDVIDASERGNNGSLTTKKTEQELEEWKSEQEHIFKAQMREKEKAYLRILSEEWKKKDADRENQISEKIRFLQLKESELAKQMELFAKKEGSHKQLEIENLYLKEKLKECEKLCDELRSRISKLYRESEFLKKQANLNLQAENENLKIQLLANQQRNELMEDHKSVKKVALQLKTLRNSIK